MYFNNVPIIFKGIDNRSFVLTLISLQNRNIHLNRYNILQYSVCCLSQIPVLFRPSV